MDKNETTRRDFLSVTLAGGAVMALGDALLAATAGETVDGMPYRTLGKTREKVSLLCVGGFHIGVPDEAEAIRMIQEAVDNGVNFMDNAWEYHKGESERRMGKALKGARRDKAFIMTKHHGRDKKTAMRHLEGSLRNLQTDHIDLWQYHEVVYDEDPDMIFAANGGGIEAADLARKQGKVRYIGFTGHKWPWIHLKMLGYGYPWDAVQMPLNVFDANFQSFTQKVLPVLVKREIGVLAMKTRAGGGLIKEGTCTIEELWRYVTGLPISTVVSGMRSLDELRANLKLARELKPMSPAEMAAIRKRTRALASTGKHERYKISRAFDGPEGRKLHGIS